MCRKASSHEPVVQMKRHVESKKRLLLFHRLARSLRENIVVIGLACLLFLVCLMIGFHVGQMIADYDEDGARTLRKPQRTELGQAPHGSMNNNNPRKQTQNTASRSSHDPEASARVIDADALEAYNLSPYERRWPRYSVDPWMRKIVDRYPPKEKEVCLVHVGKSAGYTVACALGFPSPGCEQTYNLGLLPEYTTKWSHAGLYDCFDDSAFYLFIVRNPLDRAVSAFNYGKPYSWEKAKSRGERYYQRLKRLYLDCFDTIGQLADWGLSKDGNATSTCKLRASEAIEGSTRFENHLFFNFQYHLEMIPTDSRIITIRTEHLVEDWNSAELAVGGKKNILGQNQTVIPHINTGNPAYEKFLTDESRGLICTKLCNEIQVYKRILRESVNLNAEQVQESMVELNRSCPIEAAATSCVSPLPDIADKLMRFRGYDEGYVLDEFNVMISLGRGVHYSNAAPAN